jgi:hypothetical protein
MAVALTIENLSAIQKLLKNAQRASRAVIYSRTGGFEPVKDLEDVATLRAVILGSADVATAAKNLIDHISNRVQ